MNPMVEEPTISVLMTVYNREKYLAEAIESVLASDFTDFEYIIVDDCSTDRSVEIAKAYAAKDSRIRCYQNSENLGDYPNRNQAASYAKGRYLKYVDSDDTIATHCLSHMIKAMEAFPQAALGLCQKRDDIYPQQLTPQETYKRSFLENDRAVLGNAPLSVIIRHSTFKAHGGFSGQNYSGDGELWLKMSAQDPILLLESGLVYWRKHGDQEFNTGHQSGAQFTFGFLKDIAAINAPNCPLNANEVPIALRRCQWYHSRFIIRLLKSGHLARAWEIKTNSGITFINLLRAFAPIPEITPKQ